MDGTGRGGERRLWKANESASGSKDTIRVQGYHQGPVVQLLGLYKWDDQNQISNMWNYAKTIAKTPSLQAPLGRHAAGWEPNAQPSNSNASDAAQPSHRLHPTLGARHARPHFSEASLFGISRMGNYACRRWHDETAGAKGENQDVRECSGACLNASSHQHAPSLTRPARPWEKRIFR